MCCDASRQANPSSTSRMAKISLTSQSDRFTTRTPTCGTRCTSRRPSRRLIASRSGPRLIPSCPANSASPRAAPGGRLPIENRALQRVAGQVGQRLHIDALHPH